MLSFKAIGKFLVQYSSGIAVHSFDFGNSFTANYLAKYLQKWAKQAADRGMLMGFIPQSKFVFFESYYLASIKDLSIHRVDQE